MAHRPLCHSALGWRVMKKRKRKHVPWCRTRQTLEPLAWRWSHCHCRLVLSADSIYAPSWRAHAPLRCRANLAHVRQSRPDYGLRFQVKVLSAFNVVRSSFGTTRGQKMTSLICAKFSDSGLPRTRFHLEVVEGLGRRVYSGTSLIRNIPLLGPYSMTIFTSKNSSSEGQALSSLAW